MSGFLHGLGGFLKGASVGVYQGAKSMVTSTADMVVGVAGAGKQLLTNPDYREKVWTGAKAIANTTAGWTSRQLEEAAANPVGKLRQVRDGVANAYDLALHGADKALAAYAEAKEQAEREGRLAEFYGTIVGRGGFEVGSLLIPASKLGRIAGISKLTKGVEGVADAGKLGEGLEKAVAVSQAAGKAGQKAAGKAARKAAEGTPKALKAKAKEQVRKAAAKSASQKPGALVTECPYFKRGMRPPINSKPWYRLYGKAIKSSNMLPHHVAGFAKVANTRKEVIIVRNVNEYAQPWIKIGCPTKDLHIKGKSASWGPHAGLIPENQQYSKLTNVGDVEEYNTKVKNLLAEKPPAAKALPLRIPPPEGEPVTVHANLAPPPSEVMKVGEHYYRAAPPGDKLLSDAIKPTPDGVPLTVLTDPKSGIPITADYDLLAIGKIPQPNQPGSKIISNAERGTLSRSEARTLSTLQRITETPSRGRASQRVVHHGPENRNPDTKVGRLAHSDFPMTSYMPDGSVRSIESEQQLLDLFNDMNVKGYNLSPHPGWGWGDPSGGRYALPK